MSKIKPRLFYRSFMLAMLLAASLPMLSGCNRAAAATLYGTVWWFDLGMTPVRSLLGTLTLNLINSL